jgi:hypothetical protein
MHFITEIAIYRYGYLCLCDFCVSRERVRSEYVDMNNGRTYYRALCIQHRVPYPRTGTLVSQCIQQRLTVYVSSSKTVNPIFPVKPKDLVHVVRILLSCCTAHDLMKVGRSYTQYLKNGSGKLSFVEVVPRAATSGYKVSNLSASHLQNRE